VRILTDAAIIVKGEKLGVYYTFFHKFLFDDFSIRADGGSVKTDDRDFVLGDDGWHFSTPALREPARSYAASSGTGTAVMLSLFQHLCKF